MGSQAPEQVLVPHAFLHPLLYLDMLSRKITQRPHQNDRHVFAGASPFLPGPGYQGLSSVFLCFSMFPDAPTGHRLAYEEQEAQFSGVLSKRASMLQTQSRVLPQLCFNHQTTQQV